MNFQAKLKRLTAITTKTKVCRRAGLPAMTITNLLARGSTPQIDTAVKLAKALGVDPGWLIDDSRTWPPVRVDEPDKVGAAA